MVTFLHDDILRQPEGYKQEDELKEEDELGAFRTFTVVVGGNGELTAKIGDLILFKMDRQLQLNGCPVLGIS